ncbi:ATP-binding protein [Streptomyces sp. NPDC019396]|uniref:sensor histidine kinase n=1 Tax=Streptomyces sp. NPDC019396 TaxID=3154687 RepID=UPI003410A150
MTTGHNEAPPHCGTGPSGRTKGAWLTVTQWFWLAFTAVLVGVCGFAAGGAQLLSENAAKSDELVDRIQPARVDAYRFQKAFIDQETGIRGYALSRDSRWLDPYTQGQRDAASAGRALRSGLADDDSRVLASLSRVERLADAWRSGYAVPLVARVREGGSVTSDSEELRASKAAFDRLRAGFDTLNADLLADRNAARSEMHRTRAAHNWLFAGMLGAFVVIALGLAVLLYKAVARPLTSLRLASQRVADGDFDRPIEPAGPADIQHLADVVESMRRRVITALGESRTRADLLAQRTAELDEQTVELRRSNAELEQFAYVASHDLQEPLRKVASFCQLLEKRYGDQLDDRAKQYIDFAVDGAKRMQILINDLLTYSRVGRVNDARDEVELDNALDKALANLGAAVEEAGAVIERPEHLGATTGDPTLLTMLWQNIVGNAVKFRAPERPPVVRITAERDDSGDPAGSGEGSADRESDGTGVWRYRVTDNGIGIPAEFSEKVFVIFQRLHGRDTYTGTGIGLALCKKIVEYHGGRIWIESAHTGGTEIHFTLPAAGPATTPILSSATGDHA